MQDYVNIHRHHTKTTCSNVKTSSRVPAENFTTVMPTWNASHLNPSDTDSLSPATNSSTVTPIGVMENQTRQINISRISLRRKCGKSAAFYTCELLLVSYELEMESVTASLYKSYRDYLVTDSHCSVYGCDLSDNRRHFLNETRMLNDGFQCYYDRKNTTRVFMERESIVPLAVWVVSCLLLLLLGCVPFLICLCARINTPWQGYFLYCTKRYASKQAKWIDAINKGNMFMIKWSLPQRYVNRELLDRLEKGKEWRAVPLARAAFAGQTHVAEYFISLNAIVDFEDSYRLTPLHYACLGAKVSTLKLLLSQGASVEAQDISKRTPLLTCLMLHITVPDTILCLLEAGADVAAEDKHGCSALHYACFKGDLNLVHMIIKAGCTSHDSIYLTKSTFHSELQNTPIGTNYGFTSDLYTSTWSPLTSLLYRNSKAACVLLVAAGYRLKQDSMLHRALYSDASEDMNKFIKQHMREVTPLLRACRIWLREHLGTKNLRGKIAKLKIAEPLRDYLNLEIID